MASLGKRLQYFNLFYNQLKPTHYLQNVVKHKKNNTLRINEYNNALLFMFIRSFVSKIDPIRDGKMLTFSNNARNPGSHDIFEQKSLLVVCSLVTPLI